MTIYKETTTYKISMISKGKRWRASVQAGWINNRPDGGSRRAYGGDGTRKCLSIERHFDSVANFVPCYDRYCSSSGSRRLKSIGFSTTSLQPDAIATSSAAFPSAVSAI